MTDLLINQPTEQQTEIKGHREVTLPRIFEALKNGHLCLNKKK